MTAFKSFVPVLAILALGLGSMRAEAGFVYTYDAAPYDFASGTIGPGDTIKGTIVFSSVTPNSTVSTSTYDLASIGVESFQFSAGPVSINSNDLYTGYHDTITFQFDGNYNLIKWSFFWWKLTDVNGTTLEELIGSRTIFPNDKVLYQEAHQILIGVSGGEIGAGLTNQFTGIPGASFSVVPEPSSFVLISLGGLTGLGSWCRSIRRKKRAVAQLDARPDFGLDQV